LINSLQNVSGYRYNPLNKYSNANFFSKNQIKEIEGERLLSP